MKKFIRTYTGKFEMFNGSAEMMTVVKAGYNELWGFKWNKSLTGAKDTIKDVYTLFANDPNQAIILEPVKQVKYITIKYEAK